MAIIEGAIYMSKYSPLGDFLRKQRTKLVPLKFSEIERLTGVKLPRSAQRREWWSNNPDNSVLTKVWLEAGFRSEQVDMKQGKLTFRRVEATGQIDPGRTSASREAAAKPFHPLFGLLKDITRVAPGVDLTEPADPDWGKVYD
jgi:hypothetical protein